jgi:glycosyltransferase involved in cell wall biosynthesis
MSSALGGGDSPLVSIGMPVYNGERYLEAAVESVLAQTYPNWELVVSDNASTDATEGMLRAYAERDPRIRYYRNAANIGPVPNFNRVFELSHGRYFKWLGVDDTCEPTYLERCLEILGADPSTVIVSPWFDQIDQAGAFIQPQHYLLDLTAPTPHERMAALMRTNIGHELLYGLVRSEVMVRTRLMPPYNGSDRALLAEILLHGQLRMVPEVLWHSRDHPDRSFYVRRKVSHWEPKSASAARLTHLTIAIEMLRGIARAPLSNAERARCTAALARSVLGRSGRLLPIIAREVREVAAARLEAVTRPLNRAARRPD